MPQDRPSNRLKKAAATSLANDGQDAALPSKATMEKVRKLFKRYAAEISTNAELSQSSKTMYIDFADCFVRWMVGGFRPGAPGSNRRKPTSRVWPGQSLD
jgi:phosphatidylserine decarboxylase